MAARGAIFGTSGPALTAPEADFLRDADPWGFILFARNIETPAQVARLVSDLRAAVGRDAPVLIDQEGGRVARLAPPRWTGWDNALDFVARHEPGTRAAAMRLRYAIVGAELAALGIDVNCAPMADVAQPDMHPRLRERCYGGDAAEVATLGRAVAEGLAEAGVLPVLKHMPGHGRATVDSHEALPRVDAPLEALAATDFAPFRALSDLPLAMTAHIVFPALDTARPATQSAEVIGYIRQTIGFAGALMTDDLNMKALGGSIADRVTAARAAGCDLVLHCDGDLAEMAAVAAATPALTGASLRRCDAALAARPAARVTARDIPDLKARLAALGTEAAHS
jgi:beta-N-acetylhexosaminidase